MKDGLTMLFSLLSMVLAFCLSILIFKLWMFLAVSCDSVRVFIAIIITGLIMTIVLKLIERSEFNWETKDGKSDDSKKD